MFGLITVLISCNKLEREPTCIQEKVELFKTFQTEECKDKGKVKKYRFQGEIVYVFEHEECNAADLVSAIVNQNCEVIGWLGGVAGNQTINGESFDKAIYLKTIWKEN